MAASSGTTSANKAFTHQPGTAIECLSIPITLNKDPVIDADGNQVMKCGFRIGGGIDQNYQQSPHGYSDNGIYVTDISPESAASRSGLRVHDKILQCNGYDFTMVTHKKAVAYIKKNRVLNMLVARKGVTQT